MNRVDKLTYSMIDCQVTDTALPLTVKLQQLIELEERNQYLHTLVQECHQQLQTEMATNQYLRTELARMKAAHASEQPSPEAPSP